MASETTCSQTQGLTAFVYSSFLAAFGRFARFGRCSRSDEHSAGGAPTSCMFTEPTIRVYWRSLHDAERF